MFNNTEYVYPIICEGNPKYKIQSEGLTLRDYFSGKVIIGLASLQWHSGCPSFEKQAEMAYELADAMMEARKR